MLSKRVYLALKERKSNFLLIFIFISVISVFFISFMIERAARWNITEIERTYGSSFKIQILRDEINGDLWEERVLESGMSYRVYIGPNVDYEMLERISEVEGIKEYEAGRDWTVLLLGYSLVPGQGDRLYRVALEYESNGLKRGATSEELKNLIYKTDANPVRNSIYFLQFYDGTFILTQGRHIQENDQYVALISEELARRNQLKMGDTLKIDGNSLNVRGSYPVESIGSVEVEIIGIFDTTYEQIVSEYTNEDDILENWIIVDAQTGLDLNKIYGEEDYLYGGTFFVENPSELDEVMKRVKALDWIDWSYYILSKSQTLYKNAIAPLQTIRIMMNVLLGTVAVSGIILLTLLITYTTKKRTREVGILMALGISGKEIRCQIVIEHLVIGLIAYIFALGIGMWAAPVIGNELLGVLNSGSEQKIYSEQEIEAAIARGDYTEVQSMAKNQRTGIPAPETLEIGLNVWIALLVGIVEIFIIIFCVNCSMQKTLKLEPIRVLSMIR